MPCSGAQATALPIGPMARKPRAFFAPGHPPHNRPPTISPSGLNLSVLVPSCEVLIFVHWQCVRGS